jgi:hypothetical protein
MLFLTKDSFLLNLCVQLNLTKKGYNLNAVKFSLLKIIISINKYGIRFKFI